MRRTVLLLVPLLVLGADAAPNEKPADPAAVAEAIRKVVEQAAEGEAPPAEDPHRGEHVDRWVKGAAEALNGVTRSPLPPQPWGLVTMRPGKDGQPTKLYLVEFTPHGSRQLIVYGLGGEVRRSYWLGQADAVGPPPVRTDRATVFRPARQQTQLLQGHVPLPGVYVVEVDGEPKVVPLAVGPGEDGSITLHARDVIVHGRTVRYEPEPHKDTVGYWTHADDWVRWEVEVKRPGAYAVQILQGCGPGSGGSEVEMSVGEAADQKLRFTVEETKGFQDFIKRDVGKLSFPEAGVYSLKVKPVSKPGLAVMDLRMVTLKPVGG